MSTTYIIIPTNTGYYYGKLTKINSQDFAGKKNRKTRFLANSQTSNNNNKTVVIPILITFPRRSSQ